MRTVQVGKASLAIHASAPALYYYREQFGRDLIGDLLAFGDLQSNPASFSAIGVLQIAWAMARAANGVGRPFPEFLAWLDQLDEVDFSEGGLALAVLGEAAEGFFRGSRPRAPGSTGDADARPSE